MGRVHWSDTRTLRLSAAALYLLTRLSAEHAAISYDMERGLFELCNGNERVTINERTVALLRRQGLLLKHTNEYVLSTHGRSIIQNLIGLFEVGE